MLATEYITPGKWEEGKLKLSSEQFLELITNVAALQRRSISENLCCSGAVNLPLQITLITSDVV